MNKQFSAQPGRIQAEAQFDASRQRILHRIGTAEDVTLFLLPGNRGDELIRAGTRQLLAPLHCREIPIDRLGNASGHTALICGSGAWSPAYHGAANYLPQIEQRFARVIILPSTFDTSVDLVREKLAQSKAIAFARERVSYDRIRDLCEADLAHDGAFYFDFSSYRCKGRGTLEAFRSDQEGTGGRIPPKNADISLSCPTLDEWIWTIARHAHIRTDRAHVMIAAAMLGKSVEYRSSNYHKLDAIADYSLRGFPISKIEQESTHEAGPSSIAKGQLSSWSKPPWTDRLRLTKEEIASLMPGRGLLILVDDLHLDAGSRIGDWTVLPFLEKDGRYWGKPRDSAHAVEELTRLRERGARFAVFAATSFWWLQHYPGLRQHLDAHGRLVYKNDRLIAYDLAP